MLDRSSWERHTKRVPKLGQSIRTEHDCGEGRVLKVTHGDEGYSAWCFRCSDSGFIPHPAPSLSERLAQLERARNAEVRASSSVALPDPAEYNPQAWPDKARVWLYKAGLSNDDIIRLGAYWCSAMHRVVLPVIQDGRAVFWQARAIDGRQPKYLAPIADRSTIVAKYGSGPVVVITEDILSAFRVARVTEAWSALGTSLPVPIMNQLIETRRPVVLMLDPDAGGDKGTIRMLRPLSNAGMPVYIARPHRDPKYLTKQETITCINTSLPPPLHLS